jgi:hypothetical protein
MLAGQLIPPVPELELDSAELDDELLDDDEAAPPVPPLPPVPVVSPPPQLIATTTALAAASTHESRPIRSIGVGSFRLRAT